MARATGTSQPDRAGPPRMASLRPVVRMRTARGGAWLFAAACATLSAGLFIALDTRRQSASAPDVARRIPGSAFVEPPPLAIPTPAAPETAALATPPLMIDTGPPPTALPRPAPRSMSASSLPPPPPLPQTTGLVNIAPAAKLGEPAMVFDQSAGDSGASGAGGAAAGGAAGQATASSGGGDDTAVRATAIRGRSTMIVQGSLIAATLETPIESTRPGFARAIVSRDARSFDGSRVLIPRGSRLIGEYASDIQSGQKRVLVTWTRLIRPDGVAIRLGSPAADGLGQAGVPGRANTHFFARFTSAVLQSALAIGTNLASRPGNGSVIIGLPSQATGQIGQVLSPGADLRTTIKVRAGSAVTIFVARDLDFSGVTARP